ncbi:3-oxoacyl-ACP reductase family protein [Sorangium sp. So ce375]|uniref:SDR family NAD(P)-dependent oxidoreductase n=1 Tax=Sorangium sp. So ce375 TaxID=3133306 RepID=UPI003F5C0C95
MRLQGKIALVTGSSRGIGRSIAVRFAREGADVALTYHKSKEGAEAALAEVEAAGRQGHLFAVDVASVQSVQGLIRDVVARFGRLDVLVNNAGMEKRAPFWEATEEDYDAVMNTNLKAVFFGSQAMVRHLRETGRPGKIINISSVHEDLPFPHFASYCASKGGVRMLTRTLAVELRGAGITVNAIAPGAIETEINANLLKDHDKVSALLDQIPLGRLGKPEDVAGLAVFLASADADYVTGSTYFIDGGLTWNYEEQ